MENIFSKLTQREKQIALHLLAKEGIEVLVKVHLGRFLKVKPLAVYLSDMLSIRMTPNDLKMLQSSNKRNPEGVLLFQVKNQRYLLETRFLFRKNGIFLDFSNKLYLLQRRKFARIPIPRQFAQTASLIERGGQRKDIPCMINNISAGGLNVQVDSGLKIKSLEKIRIEFQILNSPYIRISGEIRHIRRGSENDQVGISFESMPKSLEDRLLLTIMDVQLKILYPKKKTG